MKSSGIIVGCIVVAAILVGLSAYTVDETEQVIITRFGRVMGEAVRDPGLHFRFPIIEKVNRFPKNLLHWDGDPGEIPTLDKTYIFVDTFARWKIVDPILFFRTVLNQNNARGKLDEIIDPAVRNLITSYPLIETVRNSNRNLDDFEFDLDENGENQDKPESALLVTTGREKITEQIMKQAQVKLKSFGIEVVDVKIKRVNYVPKVQQAVFQRMIAERNRDAEKYRSEGRGEAQKILGEMDRDLKRIESEAFRTAEEIKGEADAEVIRLYAESYGQDPEFYSYMKTLEIYGDSLNEKSSLIMSTDSEFLKYLKSYDGKPGSSFQD